MYGMQEEFARRGPTRAVECSPDKTKVLVAHENGLVCAGLEAALRAEPDFEVVSYDSGDAFEMPSPASMRAVDVVITECETGLELIRSHPRACRVLIVTADDSETSIRRAVEQGVAGYLLLTSSRESVVRAVRRIHNGATELDPAVTSKVVASLTSPALSPRQLEVLALMMAGLGDKAIARRLGRSLGTAKSHVKSVLSKLDSGSRTEAVAVARRRGLVPSVAPGREGGSPEGRPSAATFGAQPVGSAWAPLRGRI